MTRAKGLSDGLNSLYMVEAKFQILPLEKLVLHEKSDPLRVKSLIAELKKSQTLFDPIIVTRLNSEYLVLDGATRTTAFIKMKMKKIAAQVVDYFDDRIDILTWNYLVSDQGEKILRITDKDIVRLNEIADKFIGSKIDRVNNEEPVEGKTLVIFPRFSKKEIVDLVMNGQVIPAGLTRHVILNRITGIDMSLNQFEK